MTAPKLQTITVPVGADFGPLAQQLRAAADLLDPPPVDPSKVTVDRWVLEVLRNRAASQAGSWVGDGAIKEATVALGVVSPDPTSDECPTCGGSKVIPDPECTCTPRGSENFSLCPHEPYACPGCGPTPDQQAAASPVAAEAAPPTPVAWAIEWPRDGFGSALFTDQEEANSLCVEVGALRVVPLYAAPPAPVVGEGQAIVNIAKFKAECYDAVGNIAPVDRTLRAIMLAFDAALAAVSEATP